MLTTINSIAIIYLFFLKIQDSKVFSFRVDTTFWSKTVCGVAFIYKRKRFLYLPIRNKRKAILKEDVERLLKEKSCHRRQSLRAKFSWLETIEDVEQFKKDFSLVDEFFVQKLVFDFKSKNNI